MESNNVNTQIPTTSSLMDPQAWLFGGHTKVIKQKNRGPKCSIVIYFRNLLIA